MISEGSIVLQVDAGNVFHINTIDVSLAKDAGKGLMQMSGSALISELDSRLMMNAEIDTVMPALNRGHVGISARDLDKAKKYAPALKSSDILGSVDLSIDASRKRTDTEDVVEWGSTASLRGFVFHSQNLSVNLKDRYLETKSRGTYDLKQGLLKIDAFRTGLSGTNVLDTHGTVKNIFSDKPEIHVAAEIHGVSVRSVQDIVSGPYADRIPEIVTDGAVSATLAVNGGLSAPEIEGEAFLSGKKLSWKNLRVRSFRVKLPFALEGNSLFLKDATATAADIGSSSPPAGNVVAFSLGNIKLSVLSLTYKEQMVGSAKFQIDADKAVVFGNKKEYVVEKNVSIGGVLEGNTDDRRFTVRNISLNTDFIKTISGSARIGVNDSVSIDADLVYDHIDVKEFTQRFFPVFLREKGLRVKGMGRFQTSLQATVPQNAPLRVSGSVYLTLMNAGFSSSDETMIGEGIDLKASSVFGSTLPFSQVNFRLDSEMTGFELLMGKFYGSFKDRVLGFSAAGRYADGSLMITESRLDAARIGSMGLSGTVSEIARSPSLDADIQITDLSNSEAYDLFIRDTFQDRVPTLSRLRIDGESDARLHVRGDLKRFTASGDIHITGMNITDNGSGNAVRGINMSLPVYLTYPEALRKQEPEAFGALRIKDVSWSAVRLQGIEVYPSVRQNSVILKEAVKLPLMGGDIVLKNISYGDIFSPGRQLRLSAEIRDIDLEQASSAFKLPKFSGRLSGDIPLLRLSRNSLFTDGEIVLDVFGGKIKIGDLSIDNVFSNIASLKSDIEFEEIDLGKLTTTFEFGHISGLIRGKIDDLVIVNGQAEGFHAVVESYKKKDVSQKINVEALKKITILGTGSSPSILDRGIYRFFREFRYEKLGFRASLKNDNLVLLGVEKEGDRGYLVRGGLLPPKVDVINYTHNISYQEMVRRLKRIKQAEK